MADESVGSLLIQIKADTSTLTASFAEASGEVKAFAGEISSGFSELGKTLAEAFAVEKITEFFKEGIKDFADLDKSITQVQFNLERFGQATGTSREEMKAWAQQIQDTTLFTDNEAITTLNKFVTMTHDYTASLQLSKLAMDVSAATGLELTQIQIGLGNAFEGNNQGLGRLLRNFPDLKKQIEEGGDAVQILESQFGGMSEKIGQAGLAGDLFHLQEAWKDVAKDFAAENESTIRDMIEGFKVLAGWVKILLENFLKLGQTLGVVFGNVAANFIAMKDLLTGNFREAIAEVNANAKAFGDELKEIWGKKGEEAGTKLGEGVKKGILKSKPAPADLDFIESFGQAMQKVIDKAPTLGEALKHVNDKQTVFFSTFKKGTDEYKKELDEAQKKMEAFAKKIDEVSKAGGKALAEGIGNGFTDLVKEIHKGTVSLAESFAILGKSIFKSMVIATGQVLIQEGAADFARAIAALISGVGAGAAPGLFAAGAELTAAGGTIVGIGEAALAEGGIVDRPTHALIGEGGEAEAVIPLSKLAEMGYGGGMKLEGGIHLHIHTPNASDARRPGFAKDAGHSILSALDAEQRRQGIRKKRGG